jgi:hypothetical protein
MLLKEATACAILALALRVNQMTVTRHVWEIVLRYAEIDSKILSTK